MASKAAKTLVQSISETPRAFPSTGNASPRLALRPAEAATALGISQRKLWELTASNSIPHVKCGTCVLYPIHLLQGWLSDQAQGGAR